MKKLILSQNDIDNSESDQNQSDFDQAWEAAFGEDSTEVFTETEFFDWFEEVLQFGNETN